MADLVITASSVVAGAGAATTNDTAGGTITAGMPIYSDSTDSNEYKAAQSDTSAKATVKGIALTGSSDGQPVHYLKSGPLTLGAILTTGTVYVLSNTSGKIAPVGDLASTHFVTVLGVATSTSVLQVAINNSGAQVP